MGISELFQEHLDGGLTTGSYELQVRLREVDEVPGVTVRYADLRYATNGIEAFGLAQGAAAFRPFAVRGGEP